jgi:hypothetical protein
MKRLMIIAAALLSAACTDSDLSTPEGRERAARLRAVSADIQKHQWDTWPTYTPQAPRMTVCTPAGYILVCQ